MEIGVALKHFFTKERSQPRIDTAKPPPSEYIKDTPYSDIKDKDHYVFACNGVVIHYPPAEDKIRVFVKDTKVKPIDEASRVAEIDFIPKGFQGKKNNEPEPVLTFAQKTAVLAHGIAGMDAFLKFLKEHPELSKPEVLWGETNQRMADVAIKLGFEKSDNSVSHKAILLGNFDTVRQRFESLSRLRNGKDIASGIIDRSNSKRTAITESVA